jgi:hypothetical protein
LPRRLCGLVVVDAGSGDTELTRQCRFVLASDDACPKRRSPICSEGWLAAFIKALLLRYRDPLAHRPESWSWFVAMFAAIGKPFHG